MISRDGRVSSVQAPTLASVVAGRLEDEVVAAGWPVGEVLGSERELLERFGVSRAVLREAVRIVEHTGAARMRRGPGGGLVVVRPRRDALVSACEVWFSYIGATVAEMLEIRGPLLVASARLASERGTPEAAAVLLGLTDSLRQRERITLEDMSRIDRQLADMTANPSLALFSDTLADLGIGRLRGGWAEIRPAFTPAESKAHVGAYADLGAAVAAGRVEGAEASARELLDAGRDRVVDRRQAEPLQRRRGGPAKLAEQVAAALRDDIERAGWPVGSVVGSESELIDRHGVSRAILREAVRILEHHRAVRTKRGPHGGLLVAAPDVAFVRRASRLFLEYEGVTAEGLSETRSIVEVAIAGLAAGRVTASSRTALAAVLDVEGRTAEAAKTFLGVHEQIATASGNRLAVLFVDILADLVSDHLRPDRRTPEALAEMSVAAHRAHERIVAAVLSGDAELARRRMRRHLDAGAGVLQ